MDIIKRRQHYVPKTYLKAFSSRGKNNDINVSNKVFAIDDEQTMSLNKYQYGHSASGIIMSKNEDTLRKQCAIIADPQ